MDQMLEKHTYLWLLHAEEKSFPNIKEMEYPYVQKLAEGEYLLW